MSDTTVRRPRRVTPRALALGIASLAMAGALTWVPAATTGWSQGAAESTLWQLMNGARINNGRAPVQSHGTLVGLARWRSADMLAKDYFSHTIAGCGCLVYPYYDSNGLVYGWAGENIGWNSGVSDDQSPVRVHEKFMASPGHRVNVLDYRFTHAGVGAAAADGKMFQGYVQNTRMYTELFMEAAGSAPAPAPAPQPGPQPAPAPGSGGGGGGGGGGTATAPSQPRASKARKPKAMPVRIDTLARPHSSAGIDGVAVVVSAPADDVMISRLRSEELAAARAAALEVRQPASAQGATATTATPAASMEVTTAAEPEPGLLESVVNGILGFLFG
jgi:uncharacterized protein YkwD